ncbi:sepiapterin reductase b [Hippocampus comes]|uniref:sepiapterin reductase b n=1 Tax=Hippocampus comes TaxID=109280 RepID=UPI00094E8D9B|nr:PREDICTED: sepiapterin reductase-like [Hippocampus comes]
MCIITGASKGFGRALAHLVLNYLKTGSVLLLVARSRPLLQQLKEELLQNLKDMQEITIFCTVADLSTKEGVEDTVAMARQQSLKEIDHVLLINNAGNKAPIEYGLRRLFHRLFFTVNVKVAGARASLGDISPFENFTELERVNSYLAFNVSSVLALTAGMLQAFPPRAGLQWSVVNCSSMFAVQALPSWVLYCTAKAARDMMFRVLAVENPNVKVLSYAPGPMDTQMQEDIRRLTGIQYHLHPCRDSAAKLMRLLLDNDFVTACHVDFFDL